jgi:hypothetical protein
MFHCLSSWYAVSATSPSVHHCDSDVGFGVVIRQTVDSIANIPMGKKLNIPEMSLNIQGLLFSKVVPTEGVAYPQRNYLHISLCTAVQAFGSSPLFQFLNPIHGRTPWTGDQPVARPSPTHRPTQTQ